MISRILRKTIFAFNIAATLKQLILLKIYKNNFFLFVRFEKIIYVID